MTGVTMVAWLTEGQLVAENITHMPILLQNTWLRWSTWLRPCLIRPKPDLDFKIRILKPRGCKQTESWIRIRIVDTRRSNRVLHTLDVVADNCLTGHFRLARPHWNNMARFSCHEYPNPLQMYGWVICFEINCTWKQMSHRVMFAYRCWSEI